MQVATSGALPARVWGSTRTVSARPFVPDWYGHTQDHAEWRDHAPGQTCQTCTNDINLQSSLAHLSARARIDKFVRDARAEWAHVGHDFKIESPWGNNHYGP
eukprot:7850972-Pyramimonas_sp.AAC.1